MALMGSHRGGPAKIAILGSSLFGTISGNGVLQSQTVGVVTHPDDEASCTAFSSLSPLRSKPAPRPAAIDCRR